MDYVVVGASAAGINGAKELRKLDPHANITLISKDEHIYSRCILHHYLEGIRTIEQLNFTEVDFIEKYRINWLKGIALESIDPHAKQLKLSNGEKLPYDKVLLATGASTFFPPVTHLNVAKNVFGLRNLDDAIKIREQAKQATHIVVMGAGLVGIDALEGMLHYGKDLTLVEFQGNMLSLQLDKEAAFAYEQAFADEGVKQYYSTAVQEAVMDEDGAVKALKLSNGETIPCDFLVVATGVRSNVAFLEGSGIETDRFGLLFNEFGETNMPDVYGAGDVSGRNPIWPAAVKEGVIAASNMVGKRLQLTDFFASKSTMNFLGIPTMSLGRPNPEDDSYTVEVHRDERGNYKKVIHKDGIIYGAILQGDINYAGILTQMVKNGIPTDRVQKPLFELDYSDFFQQTDQLGFTFNL